MSGLTEEKFLTTNKSVPILTTSTNYIQVIMNVAHSPARAANIVVCAKKKQLFPHLSSPTCPATGYFSFGRQLLIFIIDENDKCKYYFELELAQN